jgi:hypothetical protein
LDANTYSFNYNEWGNVNDEYQQLLDKANKINNQLATEYKDAYFQLVLHPVKAMANLVEMYYNVALNKQAWANRWDNTNSYADKVKQLYQNDSLITSAYHQLHSGKWNHMMDQKHIGYTFWQEPRIQKMPELKYISPDSVTITYDSTAVLRTAVHPLKDNSNRFFEKNGYVSINADHYTKAIGKNGIYWKLLPDLGKTGSSVTAFPVTAPAQVPGGDSPHLEYEFYSYSEDSLAVFACFSPTLNFQNTAEGLQYAVSIDNEQPVVMSINGDDKNTGAGIWNKWVSDNIIIKKTKHINIAAGKHRLYFWMMQPGVVLQKLMIDFGGLKPSYLGPPETIIR